MNAQMMFPLFLKLQQRPCVVVGGGVIAEGKIRDLLEAGAKVTVIAPEATESIATWSREGRLMWKMRQFRAGDLRGSLLVVAAVDDDSINSAVHAEAKASGVLCNAVDDPENCDFYYPSVVRRGPLQIAISTAGNSPALAQRLRSELEQQFGPEYEQWVKELGEARHRLFEQANIDPEYRRQKLKELASEASFQTFIVAFRHAEAGKSEDVA